MTSDELLKRLENGPQGEPVQRWWFTTNLDLRNGTKQVSMAPFDAAAYIRELEAELDALKSDLSGYMNAANTYVNELHGVHSGTHTIVPVEPTPEMLLAGWKAYCDTPVTRQRDSWKQRLAEAFHAMIRAAQPDASD